MCRRLRIAAGKGFGSNLPAKKTVDDGPAVAGQQERVKTVKFKGKRSMRRGPQSQQQAPPQPGFNVLQEGSEEKKENLADQIEFEQRLKALQAESAALRQQNQQAAATGGGILDAMRQQDEDIYANPPPLTKTLLSRDDGAAKEYEGSKFGPSQAGLAVAAVLLGAIFLITSGGPDVAPAPRQQQTMVAASSAQQQLSEETRKELEQELATYKEQAEQDGSNLEALESAAVLSARLGKFSEAEPLLVRLAEARPDDAEVLRVLAESQAAQAKWGPAAGSYRKAWEASGRSSLEVLQGLAAVLVADSKEASAIDTIKAAQGEGGGSVAEAELQLLAARTFAQWRGHVPDAVAIYDELIQSRPEDFRPYLAKGLLLQDQGRAGDAQRYFIQARYYAKENKGVVDSIIAARQQQQ